MSSNENIAYSLLKRAHSPEAAEKIFSEKVQLRPLLLKASEQSATTPNARTYRRQVRLAKEARRKKTVKPKPLSAKEKKALGIHETTKEDQKYSIFEPLHELWVGHMQEILGANAESFKAVNLGSAAILCSADYHGAHLEVVRSRCPSRIGLRGIVIRDTKYTFEIITTSNALKVVPKEHTVFRFEVPVPAQKAIQAVQSRMAKTMTFEIHGDQFQHRAVDRANKKQKPRWLPDI